MPSWEFPADGPVDLQVRVPSGDVIVSAAATQTATVTLDSHRPGRKGEEYVAATRVEFDGGSLSVLAPEGSAFGRHASLTIAVELPEGSSGRIVTASADVRCTGELAALDVHTASGDVSAERITGRARVDTASGDVALARAGEAAVAATSGDVRIGSADGVSVQTASGDVQVEAVTGHRAEVKSASGDIRVGVTPGIGVRLDLSSLSGTVNCELEPAEETGGADMTLYCRTLSGDVLVSRAAPAAAR